eukprot:SAG25_NODE_6030_length_595_cov_1.012097_2_plen_53_part_01
MRRQEDHPQHGRDGYDDLELGDVVVLLQHARELGEPQHLAQPKQPQHLEGAQV